MDPYILALMNDSLDSWLADVPDWTSSQGEELMVRTMKTNCLSTRAVQISMVGIRYLP